MQRKETEIGSREAHKVEKSGIVIRRTKAGEKKETVGGRREWDMSQAQSISTRLPHPCLFVLFIHCTY